MLRSLILMRFCSGLIWPYLATHYPPPLLPRRRHHTVATTGPISLVGWGSGAATAVEAAARLAWELQPGQLEVVSAEPSLFRARVRMFVLPLLLLTCVYSYHIYI